MFVQGKEIGRNLKAENNEQQLLGNREAAKVKARITFTKETPESFDVETDNPKS